MDFIAGKHAAAREIALAFGVPPQLLGIPGDATYSNYREANGAFWRGTVVAVGDQDGGGHDGLAAAAGSRTAASRRIWTPCRRCSRSATPCGRGWRRRAS